MRPSALQRHQHPSVPSLLLLLLATTAVVPSCAASGNIKDVLDVVLPRDPLAISHLKWPRQDPPPPPPDGDGPHDGPPPDGPPDGGRPHNGPGPLGGPDPLALDAAPPPPAGPGSTSMSNLQAFQEALGGIAAGPITESGDTQRRYEAHGNTFPTFIEAATRTCEVQFNDCTIKANNEAATANDNSMAQKAELSIDACEAQRTRCLSFQSNSASVTTFPDQQSSTTSSSSSTTSTSTSVVPMTVNPTTSTLSMTSTMSTTTASMSAAAAAPPPPPPPPGPTGTQLINLGPDPQFPMFDLLCDL